MSLADLFTAELAEIQQQSTAAEARMLRSIKRCQALAADLADGEPAPDESATPAGSSAERLAVIQRLLDELKEMDD